ncbi:MAG TPA: hypothetical protein VGU44_04595 [Gammaproteobacteria bacterium]|nr:hypothetical protein [Gammaproteobacteria bacterium]
MKSNTFSLRSYAAMGVLAGVFAVPAVSGHELFRPYVGVGAQVLKLELDKAYGKPLFSRGVVPGGTAFVGIRMGDFVGAELGYNHFSRKRETVLGGQDIYPGTGRTVIQFFNSAFLRLKTEAQIKDFNLGLTGYLPLEKIGCAFNKTEIFGALGVSRTSIRLRETIIVDDAGQVPNPQTHTFKQKRTVPIVRVGLQQNITENINLSLFSEWKRLSSFKIKSPTNPVTNFELRLKDSLSYGLRLGYIF